MYKILFPLLIVSILMFLISCDRFGTDPVKATPEEILFIRYSGWVSELCTIHPDGSNFQVLASHDGTGQFSREGYADAAWSPDKSYIALNGGPNEFLEVIPIWLVSPDGVFLDMLTWGGTHPVWYDANTLYYIQAKNSVAMPTDLYCIDILTKETDLIYPSNTYCGWGNFLDQTHWIALDTWILPGSQGNNSDIVLFNLQSGATEYLTETPEIVELPGALISPDKSKLLYVAMYDTSLAPRNLYWFDMEDKIPNQLTHYTGCNPYQNSHFVWGPNSDKVAFSNPNPMNTGMSGFNSILDIFIIDIFTGEIDTLTHFAADSITNLVVDWK